MVCRVSEKGVKEEKGCVLKSAGKLLGQLWEFASFSQCYGSILNAGPGRICRIQIKIE